MGSPISTGPVQTRLIATSMAAMDGRAAEPIDLARTNLRI